MLNKGHQSKHWENKSLDIIKSYYTSPPANARSKWFAEELRKYEFNSICEAGVFAGRNIKHILEEFDGVSVSGFDINEKAIRFAKDKNPEADLWNMNIYDIGNCDKMFDILFTSGTMIHLLPDTIGDVISGMVSRSNKYVMHIEECGAGEVIKGPKSMKPKKKVSDQIQFAPDLVGEYKKIGYSAKVISLPDQIRTNGASELVVVKI